MSILALICHKSSSATSLHIFTARDKAGIKMFDILIYFNLCEIASRISFLIDKALAGLILEMSFVILFKRLVFNLV